MASPAWAEVANSAAESVRTVRGVEWAAWEPGLARLVVSFEGDRTKLEDIRAAVETAEAACGVSDDRFPASQGDHPGDWEPSGRQLFALAADMVGLGLGVFGRVLHAMPLPVEVASLVTFVDNEPRMRGVLEAAVGTPAADVGLAVGNALAQGLAQGALGLVADIVHRGGLLAEASGLRRAFQIAEAQRWSGGPNPDIPGLDQPDLRRPRPLPVGPVERYAERSGLAAVGAATATFAGTGSTRRAGAIMVAGLPKAGRMGRESFAVHLSRALIGRDMVVLDPRALRRFDRVDTVVVDEAVLRTGRATVHGVCAVGDAHEAEINRQLSALFDPFDPRCPRGADGWELAPLTRAERRNMSVRPVLRDAGAAAKGLGLHHAGRLVAVVGYGDELSAAAQHLVLAARRQGHMVAVAGDDLSIVEAVRADLLVAGGPATADAVRSLQHDGCVVVVVAEGGPARAAGLRAADIGLELADLDGSAWAGDVILNTVDDAAFVIDAIGSSREVSRQSVAVGVTGSALGALMAVAGPPRSAATRASRAVNVAALAGIANGLRAAVHLNRHGGAVPVQPTEWHTLGTGEVLDRLASSPDGLTADVASGRVQDLEAAREPAPSLIRAIGAELINPLTPVLAGGAAASAAVGSVTDAAMIAGVSTLNAVIGGAQRFGAERAIQALSESSSHPVTVRRGGVAQECPSDALAPGDIVNLRAGDSVPADCRVLEAADLLVDESALTGESEPVTKDPGPVFSVVLAERSSMIYEGTTIAAGEVTAVAVAVGASTTATAMAADTLERTVAGGVEARLRDLTAITMPVSLGGGAVMLANGMLRRHALTQSVSSAVALAVAAVPEGLPLLATMAQLASAHRLSQRGALVRNPRAVEALGRIRVLCTDKTGTLTEGRIRLSQVSDGTNEADATRLAGHHATILAAGLRASPRPQRGARLPHLTDQAVVEGAARAEVATTLGAPAWRALQELPFEPASAYHAVLGACDAGQLVSVKGAPETVISRCERWTSPSGPVTLDSRGRRSLHRKVDAMARRGLRILAVAEKGYGEAVALGAFDEGHITGLTLLGFLLLSDPIRSSAPEAVSGLGRAGVGVVMVTGDHPSTAKGIAVELGILNGHRVVTGGDLAIMADTALDAIIDNVSVFARVTPADKVRIVAALQRRGQAVAMTGDGANDAPAIRLADVGIALGARSTPSARRAADLIITDEHIETIVDAIVEGRGMWTSVREALAILLGGNLGEVIFTVGATVLTGRTPLSARQLLVVNLLTDVAPALAIALRPPPRQDPEALLAEGPDASLGASLERAIMIRAASTTGGASAAWILGRLTGGPKRASTTALVALVGSQLGQTITGGGLDPLVIAAGGGSALLLAAIVQTPGVSQFFGCTPLDPIAWAIALSAAGTATAASAIASRMLRPPAQYAVDGLRPACPPSACGTTRAR